MKKTLFIPFFLVFLFIFSGIIFAEDKKRITREEVIVEEESSESRASSVVGGEKTTAGKKPVIVKKSPEKPKIKPKVSVSKKKIASIQKKYKKKITKKVWEEEMKELKADPCEEMRLVITSFSTTGPKKEKEKDQVEIFGVGKIPKGGKISIEFRSGVSDFASLAEIEVKGGVATQLHVPTTPLTIGNWYGARMVAELPDGIHCYSAEVPFRITKETPAREKESTPSVFFESGSGYYGGGYYDSGHHYRRHHDHYVSSPPPPTTTPVTPSGRPGLDPPAHR